MNILSSFDTGRSDTFARKNIIKHYNENLIFRSLKKILKKIN